MPNLREIRQVFYGLGKFLSRQIFTSRNHLGGFRYMNFLFFEFFKNYSSDFKNFGVNRSGSWRPTIWYRSSPGRGGISRLIAEKPQKLSKIRVIRAINSTKLTQILKIFIYRRRANSTLRNKTKINYIYWQKFSK